jgi:iron complex outermembrane receptor protein
MADDVASGCVAVNMFAPSLYPEDIVGEFATQAETDYLFDSRDFDTEYEQTVFLATMGRYSV